MQYTGIKYSIETSEFQNTVVFLLIDKSRTSNVHVVR